MGEQQQQQAANTDAMNETIRERWHSSVTYLVNELRSHRPQPSGDEDAAADGTISSLSTKWLDKVSSLYNEPHRAYHNMKHIEDVLTSLDLLLGAQSDASVDMSVVTLAAFFHDVIYSPKSATNEKDSADLFVEFASELSGALGESGDDATKQCKMVSQIEQCIIATAKHISSANKARQSNNTIVAAFLDADMSILGSDAGRYDRYAGSIRKEYEFVERDTYCTKRAEILESFLPATDDVASGSSSDAKQHSHIYATEKGRELWEANARQNLMREIDMLRQDIIPLEKEIS